jgi:PKHD-type hydroxylase
MPRDVAWIETKLPDDLIDIVVREAEKYELELSQSTVKGGLVKQIRSSKNSWISQTHWISGLCYQYMLQANNINFNYDISQFSKENIQYTKYEPGDYYDWHIDTDTSVDNDNNQSRKLSLIMQLSNYDEYSGGEVQFLTDSNDTFFVPKIKGTVIIFDSRLRHRVRSVKSGTRKSLVAWASGPKWR